MEAIATEFSDMTHDEMLGRAMQVELRMKT